MDIVYVLFVNVPMAGLVLGGTASLFFFFHVIGGRRPLLYSFWVILGLLSLSTGALGLLVNAAVAGLLIRIVLRDRKTNPEGDLDPRYRPKRPGLYAILSLVIAVASLLWLGYLFSGIATPA